MAEYIEREALVAKIRNHGILGSGYSYEEQENDVISTIESIPAADVAPVVHGRWEDIRFLTTGDGRVRVGNCSSCKSIERVRNYCPECGARMDGE